MTAAKIAATPSSSSRRADARVRLPLIVALAAVVTASGCVHRAAAADSCPGERERAAGVAARIREEWPLRGSDEVTELVKDVMRRLTGAQRKRSWHVTLVRNRNAEAYSIGDGRIYISDGAVRMCESESELAAVLAHEMGHQLLGHFCQTPDSAADTHWWGRRKATVGSVSQRIDPMKELEADRYALINIERVGYDPHAALRIAQRVRGDMPRGHLDEMGRVRRLEGLLEHWPPRPGYQSEAFARVRAALLDERSARTPSPANAGDPLGAAGDQ